MLNINNLNFLNFFIGKSNLIEASAGTGKTHILSLIYLRLLLNINIDINFNNLFIDNILVVTYTDLATLEIKNRILNNIIKLRISCINNKVTDIYLKEIFNYIKNIYNIIDILINYENYIDNISIFTIHSFCKKILYLYFIHSNISSFSKVVNYNNNIIYNIILLFWRKYFYRLNINISRIIYSYWLNPKKLLDCILPILNLSNYEFNFQYNYCSIENCYSKIIYDIIYFKKKWLKYYKYIYNLFFLIKKNKLLYKYININKYLNEIFLWSKSNTIDFYIPKCINKFSYKYLSKYNILLSSKLKFFLKFIDYLLLIKNNLYNFIILKCIKYIKKKIILIKKKDNSIDFNDLIDKLYFLLLKDNNSYICNFIRLNYPILLIDEFQDTDLLQYKIFKKIYLDKNFYKTKVIFIGDPKQSIYTFRGANIFNYIKFKKNVDFLYLLNINWRSSYNLVKNINYLFSNINNSFIFNNIKYIYSKPSRKNKNLIIFKNNNIDFTMNFYIFNNINSLNYKIKIAKFCVIKIFNILNSNNYYINDLFNNKRKILPSDICILVHKNYEIKIFHDIFKEFFLPTDCILDKSNIFHTLEAKEIYFLLKSILFPQSNFNICNALSTNILGYDLLFINELFNNKNIYIELMDKFNNYYNIWKNNGIYSLVNFILKEKKNINNKINYKDEQSNINILHISEILQKKSFIIKDKYLLLNWLNKKINNLNVTYKKEYYLRSLSNNNGVKISTIHKSKGLQFNIIWIPFLIYLKNYNNYNIFHNRKNYKINIDLLNKLKYRNLMEEELISEEMRLLYVAITRSIYQCNIILYDLSFNKFNKSFCFTSIGRLISKNNYFNYMEIKNIFLKYLKVSYINLINIEINDYIKKNNFNIYKYYKNIDINFKNNLNKNILNRVINYSNLISINKKNNIYIINKIKKKEKYNLLPKGKKIGIFFHKILEKINFSNLLFNNKLLKYMFIYNINKNFFFIIKRIILNILNVYLYPLNINLVSLINVWKEFEFFIYIKKEINFKEFNYIIKKYDDISLKCEDILIDYKIKGFLNGFIDLIFMYKKKFYIIDYKSNWLGYNYNFYKLNNIKKNIIYHRYDIQYYLYSIALHNYLKLNIKNYNYKDNFGGIFNIFFRGLLLDNNNRSYTGLLYLKPNINLIVKLSNLLIK